MWHGDPRASFSTPSYGLTLHQRPIHGRAWSAWCRSTWFSRRSTPGALAGLDLLDASYRSVQGRGVLAAGPRWPMILSAVIPSAQTCRTCGNSEPSRHPSDPGGGNGRFYGAGSSMPMRGPRCDPGDPCATFLTPVSERPNIQGNRRPWRERRGGTGQGRRPVGRRRILDSPAPDSLARRTVAALIRVSWRRPLACPSSLRQSRRQ